MSGIFLTNVMPIIAVCLVWRFLLHPHGLVNQLLARFGAAGSTGSPATPPRCRRSSSSRSGASRPISWWCFSRDAAIPDDYYEPHRSTAARADRRFWYVTLPLLLRMIFFVVVVSALLWRASS